MIQGPINSDDGSEPGHAPAGGIFCDDLLRQAANSIPVGFVMFNAEKKVVVANSTFLSLYKLSPDCVQPGTHLVDLLKERFKTSGMTSDELGERVAFIEALVARQEPHSRIDTLSDGRRISVVHRPLSDGNWVGTHEDVTEKEAVAERLRYLAHHDVLTGLGNRAYFWEHVHSLAAEAEKDRIVFALHLIDLDGFKQVNDDFGHEAGDLVLKRVAERIQTTIRRVDIVARLGGDEFAIVQCQQGLAREDVEALAIRVIAEISQDIEISKATVKVGASLGIAYVSDFDWDLKALVNAADQAMYEAKRAGKNRYRLANMDA